jgi:hypothetical protein
MMTSTKTMRLRSSEYDRDEKTDWQVCGRDQRNCAHYQSDDYPGGHGKIARGKGAATLVQVHPIGFQVE